MIRSSPTKMEKILLLSVAVLRAIIATDPLASDKNPSELDSTNTSDDYHIHSDALSSHSIPEASNSPFDYSSDNHSGDYSSAYNDYSHYDKHDPNRERRSEYGPKNSSDGVNNDYQFLRKECTDRHSCLSHSDLRTCGCDPDCAVYSDCCEDALYASSQNEEEKFQCVMIREDISIYMVTSCPREWLDNQVSSLCANGNDAVAIEKSRDPVMHLPATSTTTNITYSNYYCAICNQDSRDLYVWRPVFRCNDEDYRSPYSYLSSPAGNCNGDDCEKREENNPAVINKSFEDQKIVFQRDRWVLCNDESTAVYDGCSIFSEVCEAGRRCYNNMISSCAVNWTESETENLCRSYRGLVYNILDDNELYKNRHCAHCNYVESTCKENETSGVKFATSFTVLIDFANASDSNTVHSVSCNASEIFDPFSRRCRDVVNGEYGQFGFKYHLYSNTDLNISVARKDPDNRTCRITSLYKEEYVILKDKSVHIKEYDQIYEEGDYDVNENGRLLVCYPPLTLTDTILGSIALLTLFSSCLCLIFHLFAFSLVPHLRNLPGKNLASFCVSLLGIYFSLIMGALIELYSHKCYIFAALLYFFFMASFSWMNIMAFDTWQTIRRSTKNLQVTSGKQWHKFFIYSTYGWSFPSLALIITITIDKVEPASFSSDFLPQLGGNICFIEKDKAALVLIRIPLAVTIAINILLFAATAAIMCTTNKSTAATTSVSHYKNQFLLYARLASLMGFTWFISLINSFFTSKVLFLTFMCLNCLQGTFVFLAFTCRTRVLKEVILTCHKWPLVSHISGCCRYLRCPKVTQEGRDAKKRNFISNDVCNSALDVTKTSVDQSSSSTVTVKV